MAILEILHFPDNRLRKKAFPIETIDKKICTLAHDMLETMYAYGGIGLAATQVNIQKNLIVMDLSEDKNAPIYLINPKILSTNGTTTSQEGCLSVPEYYEVIDRAEEISYCYQNLAGETIEATTNGLFAICIQHEIDHLNGKLFIDYLSPLKQQRLLKKLKKIQSQQSSRPSNMHG